MGLLNPHAGDRLSGHGSGLAGNLAVVSGSAMLTAGLSPTQRPRAEAVDEVTMGLAAAVGAGSAGMVAAASGWCALSLAAALVGGVGMLGFPYRDASGATANESSHPWLRDSDGRPIPRPDACA